MWSKWGFRSRCRPVVVDVVVDVVIDGDGDGDDRSNHPEEQPIRGHAQFPEARRLPVLGSFAALVEVAARFQRAMGERLVLVLVAVREGTEPRRLHCPRTCPLHLLGLVPGSPDR
jgi:hypothetical protein